MREEKFAPTKPRCSLPRSFRGWRFKPKAEWRRKTSFAWYSARFSIGLKTGREALAARGPGRPLPFSHVAARRRAERFPEHRDETARALVAKIDGDLLNRCAVG